MDKARRVALGAVWDEALAFCRAEAALLTPLALLGFGLPLAVLELVMPEKIVVDNVVSQGPWMAWLVPHMLLSLLGTLSISALTARPGISVREALATGIARLPAGILVVLMATGLLVVAMIPVGVVAGVEGSIAGRTGLFSLLANLLVLVLVVWLTLRLLPIWAALAAGHVSSWATVRAVLAETRGFAPQMLLLRAVSWCSQLVVLTVVMLPVQTVLQLIGRVTGAVDVAGLIAKLIGAAVAAAVVTLWTVYVAALQRRLAGLSSGT